MKEAFVHCARVILQPEADPAAPGGAVTMALCGSWDHEGPCCWPHHTKAAWVDDRGELRVIFVAEPAEEAAIRKLIDEALEGGRCLGPDGKLSRWTLSDSSPGVLAPSERTLADRMTSSRI